MPLPYGQAVPGWCTFHGWHPLACPTPKDVPQEANALDRIDSLQRRTTWCQVTNRPYGRHSRKLG